MAMPAEDSYNPAQRAIYDALSALPSARPSFPHPAIFRARSTEDLLSAELRGGTSPTHG